MSKRSFGLFFIASLLFVAWLQITSTTPLRRTPVVSFRAAEPVTFTTTDNAPNPNTILAGVNAQRLSMGVTPLRANAELADIAQARARDMSSRRYYAHQNPDGLYFDDLLREANLGAGYSCENLDLQFSTDNNLYVRDWLESRAGHRECLLNAKVTDAGYAVAVIDHSFVNGEQAPAYVVVAIHAQTDPAIASKPSR